MPFTRIRAGAVEITRVVEGDPAPLDLDFFTGDPRAVLERSPASSWLTDSGRLSMGISGFVLTVDGRNILVDSGVGDWESPGRPPGSPPSAFVAEMRAAGFERDDIDVVVSTHLHFDHVGGNTYRAADGSVRATFPEARYLIGRAEWTVQSVPPRSASPALATLDVAVRPLVESGQGELVEVNSEIVTGVRLVAAPGHTPGHGCVQIVSGDTRAIVTGDLLHHPLQVVDPSIGSVFDDDADLAAATRTSAVGRWAADSVLVLATHFPGTGIGYVEGDGASRRFVELD